MDNPWLNLPEIAPFVLDCDKKDIVAFNCKAKPEHKIHVEVLPEPYTGSPDARIILLNLNPGFYERNEKFLLGDEYFYNASRANLFHKEQEYPFYLLDPRNAGSPGYYWWSRKLKPLIDRYGLKKVANEVCVVEFFPYHSVSFGCNVFVPSQNYSLYLVRESMKRKALIIQMRSKKVWQNAIADLGSYSNYYELKNSQNPTISENNCADGFPEILGVLGASEHSTGKTHGGRIDTLGIDENGSPVIIEYKRAVNENVINQGLFLFGLADGSQGRV